MPGQDRRLFCGLTALYLKGAQPTPASWLVPSLPFEGCYLLGPRVPVIPGGLGGSSVHSPGEGKQWWTGREIRFSKGDALVETLRKLRTFHFPSPWWACAAWGVGVRTPLGGHNNLSFFSNTGHSLCFISISILRPQPAEGKRLPNSLLAASFPAAPPEA